MRKSDEDETRQINKVGRQTGAVDRESDGVGGGGENGQRCGKEKITDRSVGR